MTIYQCKMCGQPKIQVERIEDKANAVCPDCKKRKSIFDKPKIETSKDLFAEDKDEVKKDE